jgi:hypothetical protein
MRIFDRKERADPVKIKKLEQELGISDTDVIEKKSHAVLKKYDMDTLVMYPKIQNDPEKECNKILMPITDAKTRTRFPVVDYMGSTDTPIYTTGSDNPIDYVNKRTFKVGDLICGDMTNCSLSTTSGILRIDTNGKKKHQRILY